MTPDEWYARTVGLMKDTALACATQAEQWAKKTHEWKNRTHNAEKGLFGYIMDEPDKIGFGVAHTEKYGKYLETMHKEHDGKPPRSKTDWSVCEKAVQHIVPEFKLQFKNALKKRMK
jgi:hypothetical protein